MESKWQYRPPLRIIPKKTLDWIIANPDASTKQVASGLGITVSAAYARCMDLWMKHYIKFYQLTENNLVMTWRANDT